MKTRNGFTLIELLAVIIILGILMIIAIPAVTNYISNSRKNAYIDTAKKVMMSARNLVNSGKLDIYDTNTTYYIPHSCIQVENGKARSPYGEFKEAYVIVTYNKNNFNYYWISVDNSNIGIPTLTSYEELDTDSIISNIDKIKKDQIVDGTENILMLNDDCVTFSEMSPPEIGVFYDIIKSESESNYSNKTASKYNGLHQDTINGIGNKDIYYIKGYAADKINVIFAHQCWQIFRTTDTGGIRLIYNGEPDSEGKCGKNRGNHVGYNSSQTLSLSGGPYSYGSDYIFDSNSNLFKLKGSISSLQWNNNNKNSIIGKYTCKKESSSEGCTELYYVMSYVNEYNAIVLKIDNSERYEAIGTMKFNDVPRAMARVGYMYGTDYYYNGKNVPTNSNYLYGNSVTYSGGKYTLTNTKVISELSSESLIKELNNNHYTCFNTTGECNKVNYIFYARNNAAYYYELSNGKNINDMLDDMFENTNSSIVKVAIEAWYEKYMSKYTKYLEDTIFCSGRTISNTNSFNPNGGDASKWMGFSINDNKDLKCMNTRDSFTVSNSQAKLKYPVGLISKPEAKLIIEIRDIGGPSAWTMTAGSFDPTYYAEVWNFNAGSTTSSIDYSLLVKPVISIKPGINFVDGNGSMDNPYIIYSP